MINEDNKTKSQRKIWLSAAAIFLIGAIASIFYFGVPTATISNENPLAVSQEYLKTSYESPVVSRGTNAFDENWEKAIEAYNQRDFKEVNKQINPILEAGKGREKHYFYGALAYLYQEPSEPRKAVDYLKELREEYYAEAAIWYQSLAYIQLGKYKIARTLLGMLDKQNKNPQRKKEIKRLLKSLEGKE